LEDIFYFVGELRQSKSFIQKEAEEEAKKVPAKTFTAGLPDVQDITMEPWMNNVVELPNLMPSQEYSSSIRPQVPKGEY
jgi:hypothetical protein